MRVLTVRDAAERLGVSVPRVHQLIQAGRLEASKVGVQYLITESALAKVAVRKPGFPKGRKRGPKD